MMKHWKTIYKQALKDQGYHAAVERLGGEVPKTGRLKGAERKKAQSDVDSALLTALKADAVRLQLRKASHADLAWLASD